MDLSLLFTVVYYLVLGFICSLLFEKKIGIVIACLFVIFIVEAITLYFGAKTILGDDLNALGFSLTNDNKERYKEKLEKLINLSIGIIIGVPIVVIGAFYLFIKYSKPSQTTPTNVAPNVVKVVGGAVRKLLRNRVRI